MVMFQSTTLQGQTGLSQELGCICGDLLPTSGMPSPLASTVIVLLTSPGRNRTTLIEP